MNLQLIAKILQNNNYYSNQYQCIGRFLELIDYDSLKSEWHDFRRNNKYYAPPNIKNSDDICTYEGCRFLNVSVINDKVVACLEIFDGELLDGRLRDKRCEFTGIVKDTPQFLIDFAEKQLLIIAEKELIEEERRQKEIQIRNRADQILRRFSK